MIVNRMRGRLCLSILVCLELFAPTGSGGRVVGDEGELVFVQLLYRHGERTPVSFYPNDPYKTPDHWPVRPGQLMNAGKMRHYELGKWLRERYDGFLSRHYDPAEIHVQSSNVDRTLMSAQCNLLGLYPPEGSDVWNDDVPWQPIPVHTRPCHEDLYLRSDASCPSADAESMRVSRSPEVNRIRVHNKDLLVYLNEHSGAEADDVISLSASLYDTLFIESTNNFTLPNWTRAVYPEKIRPLAAFSFSMISLSPTLRRLRGGPLVSLVVENMMNKIGRSVGRGWDREERSEFDASFRELRKMEVYSAHDMTIAMFLGAMQLFPPQLPSYASTVIVELRRANISDANDDPYFVKVMYKNSSGLHTLVLPGCAEMCTLTDFDRLTKPVQTTVEEWKQECFQRLPLVLASDAYFAMFLVGFLAVAVVLILTIGISVWKRTRNGSLYARIVAEHA